MPTTNSITPATVTDTVVGLYVAVVGAPPPAMMLNVFTGALNSTDGATLIGYLNQFVESSFSKLSDGALATLVMNNLLGKDPVNSAALHDALTGLLAANHDNRGVLISQAATLLSGLENDATFGAAAHAWNARMHAALDVSGGVTLSGMTTYTLPEWK